MLVEHPTWLKGKKKGEALITFREEKVLQHLKLKSKPKVQKDNDNDWSSQVTKSLNWRKFLTLEKVNIC